MNAREYAAKPRDCERLRSVARRKQVQIRAPRDQLLGLEFVTGAGWERVYHQWHLLVKLLTVEEASCVRRFRTWSMSSEIA